LNLLNRGGEEPTGIASKFRIENGELGQQQNELSNSGNQGSVVHLENPEFHTRWYFKYFLGKVHQNYVALDGIKNPIVLSVCLTDADNYGVPQYRAILWRKTSLKLKTIVKGDAPTSLQTSTSANIKVEPWQPQFVYEDFPHKVLCGDSWELFMIAGDSVLLGTEEGIYLVQEGKSMRQLFDRSVICQQLYVLEAYGLLLFRVEKSKEFHNPRVCVFKLSDLEEDEDVVFTREDCKKHKLDRTK
ncbi:predicted protein, partial [Nematostella vectensis]